MWFQAIIGVVFIFLAIKWWQTKQNKGDLDLIPGPPRSNPLWAFITGQTSDPYKTHLTMSALAKKYGPLFKILRQDQNVVVVSDVEGLYQMTVKAGKDLSGRYSGFRFEAALENTGILGSAEADATWKALRKTTQRHLKQFGEGMSRLEHVISTIGEDMFDEIENRLGVPYDPKDLFFDTALNTIAFLITGERTRSGDFVVELMREYERLFLECLPTAVPFGMKILDIFPWLRYFGLPSWKTFQRLLTLEQEVWKTVNDMNDANPDAQSVCKVLREHVAQGAHAGDAVITETDARKTALSLLLAGVATTSRTFYALVNILAHQTDIQDKLFKEIHDITKSTRDVNLQDKSRLQYARAVILEGHRFISILPSGVRHSTTIDTKFQKYTIPAKTILIPNQWQLHHDTDFWDDPFVFQPERFLDEKGEVVPADHPNRKHLLPFGAGLRVCLGETLANTRLLIWLTTLIQRFEFIPADGNQKESTDPRGFHFEGLLRPKPYNVVFSKRS